MKQWPVRAIFKLQRKYTVQTSSLIENGEIDKLKAEEPKYKDQSTMVSFERLSLMIEYNQIGSLTSLGRRFDPDNNVRNRSNSIRRGSYTIGMFNKPSQSSTSKVDLLKSALEVNHSRKSNPHLKNSNGYLNRQNNSSGKVCNKYLYYYKK